MVRSRTRPRSDQRSVAVRPLFPVSQSHYKSVGWYEIRYVVAGMKFAGWLIGISCAVGIVAADSRVFSQPAKQVVQQPEQQWSTIQTYCFGCHNPRSEEHTSELQSQSNLVCRLL